MASVWERETAGTPSTWSWRRSTCSRCRYFTLEDGAIVSCQGGTAYYPLTRLAPAGEVLIVGPGTGWGGRQRCSARGWVPKSWASIRQRTAVPLPRSWARAGRFDPTAGPIGEQVRGVYPQGADKLFELWVRLSAHAAIGDLDAATGAWPRWSGWARPS